MIMIRAIVRPEKSAEVMAALMDAGFPAVTKVAVFGRGKQRGLRLGEVHYDELAKDELLVVVPADDKEFVVSTIARTARTGGEGAFGDGKIFVSAVDEVWTVSTATLENAVSV
jgi:nitrogen regulatory protein PII 1